MAWVLLIIAVLLFGLDYVAARLGADTRDGRDWNSRCWAGS